MKNLAILIAFALSSNAAIAGTTVTNNGTGGVGTGGTSTATGGTGGSATATIASGAVRTDNTLTNSGNSSIASGAVKNSNTNTASAYNDGNNNGSNNRLTSTASNNGNNDGSNNKLTATANGAGSNDGNGSNNTTVSYQASRSPVSTAYAPGLTSGIDTCLGSVSAGAQTQVMGFTFGGTKVDKNCITIKRTHLIAEFSAPAGCAYMLKNVPGAAEAFKDAGVTCSSIIPPAVKQELSKANADVVAMQVENQRLADMYNAMRALLIEVKGLPSKKSRQIVDQIPIPPTASAHAFDK